MFYTIKNLVFEGGGVLGIAYLGVLDFLTQCGILQKVNRVAGASAGAITACITSFNLPFEELKEIADSLDYRKIPEKEEHPDLKNIPGPVKKEWEKVFGDLDCTYRLITDYGWYSSQYFYHWIQEQISYQFDKSKKLPPYTFADFKDPGIHKGNRPFLDLYVIGTDISSRMSKVFSYETTPNMEVAEAVRISMSIPLFFEAIKVTDYEINRHPLLNIFSDGGVTRNYPINLFDAINIQEQFLYGVNAQTLGARFRSEIKYTEITSFLGFITNLVLTFLQVQQDMYRNSPADAARSIEIYTNDISAVDFNISPNDQTYRFLYQQGYAAANNYFKSRNYLI
ncbi:patatin-like phospholipase family protein [Candidatus Formimonas warabiya]|uniref:Patatin n=1 Tax=Formimonas warabiya TaxID=1761012 RepID=A0A3G1KWI4_FORW1|nr:patatin-like phospholipase family protein [Candidatus Formimonas warabiya]ATW26858.1 patatin [Candidatus Formimonas warabiya]